MGRRGDLHPFQLPTSRLMSWETQELGGSSSVPTANHLFLTPIWWVQDGDLVVGRDWHGVLGVSWVSWRF